MSISKIQGKNVPVSIWAPVHEVESQALDQLKNIAALPWVFHHVASMPDVHYGKGATVGSVVAMKGAVAPAAVGVDIGCGMAAIKTNLDVDKVDRKIKKVREALEIAVPVGFNAHESYVRSGVNDHRLVQKLDKHLEEFSNLRAGAKVESLGKKVRIQLGTLGGGNHFIELCVDTDFNIWLMLHSGSRNIGKELAEHHIGIARKLAHNASLPDKDLSVFLSKTPEMEAYRHDLYWAQEYASLNRQVMLNLCTQVLEEFWPGLTLEDPVLCHHNYVSEERHYGEDVIVTRKGAISAKAGELGIIPGSMGAKSYIVSGLGNEESFNSASHGAGRRMSRGQAKKKFTREDLIEQTNGVECRKDTGVLDEIPGAYKDIDVVMANQADLVKVVAELKGIMCIKG